MRRNVLLKDTKKRRISNLLRFHHGLNSILWREKPPILNTLLRRFRYWLSGFPVTHQRHKRPNNGIPGHCLWVSCIVHCLSLSSRISGTEFMANWLQVVTAWGFRFAKLPPSKMSGDGKIGCINNQCNATWGNRGLDETEHLFS
jgi:hypothetical protein